MKVDKNGKATCEKCGSKSQEIIFHKDDFEEYNWIEVRCRKCGHMIFYNGA